MTSFPTSTTATDKIVDVVASQAAEIAKDIAVPAAKFAAARFFQTRAKSIVALVIVGSVIAVLIKQKRGSGATTETDRPSFDGLQEAKKAEERV